MNSNFCKSLVSLEHIGRVLLLFLPIAILICSGSYFLYQKELQIQQEQYAEHEKRDVAVSVASINRALKVVYRDVIYLVNQHENQQLINSSDERRLAKLANDWVAFSNAKEIYDKIRWIDETGMERLRVDYEESGAVVTRRGKLQNKHDRYFFIETFKLKRGEIFISPFDLNVDDGQIEVPYKPTVRLGMAVFDKNGKKRGINLINYSAAELFDRIRQMTNKSDGQIWLVNQDGYWLRGATPADEFGFMFGRDDLTMAKHYPEAWKKILREGEGQFETEEGLWTFNTVLPLPDDQSSNGRNMMSGRSYEYDRPYLWKTISLLPADQYSADKGTIMVKMAGIAFILLVLFFIASDHIVRSQRREKKLLSDLAIKEERLRILIRTIPDMIWLKDGAGRYVSCNPAFERFLGAKEADIVGKTDYDFFPREQADSFRVKDQAAAEAGEMQDEEWISFEDRGYKELLEKTKVPVRTATGELVGVLGIGHNITERKRIENELRISHNLLANLAAQVPGLIYQFRLYPDGHACMPFCSESVNEMYGITPDQLRDDAYFLFSFTHPDDKGSLMASLQESARTLQRWSHEFRVVLQDNEVRWLRGDAQPQRLEDGSTLWHGYISDISESKRAEQELQLAAMVYRESSEAMMVADQGDRIIAVNPAFEEITGFNRADVLGKSPRILSSGLYDKAFYQRMKRELNTNGYWQGDLWKRRKNGELYITSCKANATFREDGTLYRQVTLFSDITEKKQSEELVWQHANFDMLTGLPNRRMFHERLEQEVKKAHRNGTSLALMFIDLDHFKDINDTLGHDSGDLLLKEAAQRLKGCVRETDTVARLGGDEFTVILGQISASENVERVGRDILQKLSEPFQLAEEVVFISGSIGVTLYPEDATEIEELLRNADQAMYAAKQQGRNRYHYFTASMQEHAQTKMRLVNDMRAAIAENQFRLMYQPIVELATGAIHKAEALIRWQHPVRGLVSPDEFIRTAEDTGMIMIIGDWVFRTATEQAARWRMLHDPQLRVSVNISPVQFRNEGINLPVWFDHLRKIGLAAEGIVF
jgi:diguanylate cyclase (GGDEF)-like protein/PAS domain S-box-containing protein